MAGLHLAPSTCLIYFKAFLWSLARKLGRLDEQDSSSSFLQSPYKDGSGQRMSIIVTCNVMSFGSWFFSEAFGF